MSFAWQSKAALARRTPRRWRVYGRLPIRRKVLECGAPAPLSTRTGTGCRLFAHLPARLTRGARDARRDRPEACSTNAMGVRTAGVEPASGRLILASRQNLASRPSSIRSSARRFLNRNRNRFRSLFSKQGSGPRVRLRLGLRLRLRLRLRGAVISPTLVTV